MIRISDLTARSLGEYALDVFMAWGRDEVGYRLAYHALILDPYEAKGLAALSLYLDADGTKPLSAVVLDYALAAESPLSDEVRRDLDVQRRRLLWGLGFARHSSGADRLPGRAFLRPERFRFDEEGYRAFLAGALEPGATAEDAFVAARNAAGVIGGLLVHRSLGVRVPMEEIVHPERFRLAPTYGAWLESDASELERLGTL